MGTNKMVVIITVVVVALGVMLSAFTVDQRELAIKFQLGKIIRSDFEPGLHFKIPFVNNVSKFDKRILTLDARPEEILTGEKKNVLVDYFVKWRISEVRDFYRTFGGRESDAEARMSQTIKDGLQSELGDRTIREVVSGEREQIMLTVSNNANDKLKAFGIEVIDVRIKQIELPPKVRESVFLRMSAERERIAKEHRARGQKESKIIRAKADRKRTEMLAAAKRQAEEIRGAGDALATETYAQAYSADADFYAFYRSLIAYRKSFSDKSDVLVLEPDSEFFRYFGKAGN